MQSLPVAVIGGGPIGLAAAAHLIERGIAVRVYEAGDAVATNIRDWGHVHLFSPWRYNIDPVSRMLLVGTCWRDPCVSPAPFPAAASCSVLPRFPSASRWRGLRPSLRMIPYSRSSRPTLPLGLA